MKYNEKFIPKEYLALKINYLKNQLEQLPQITLQKHIVHGNSLGRIKVDNHRYNLNSKIGKQSYDLMLQRNNLENLLQIYEAIWNYYFRTPVPEFDPPRVIKTINTGSGLVVMNRKYFDGLKNDANTTFPKPTNYFFNGTFYRSAAEREIAIFYTEMEIPFKYEPEVMLLGLKKPVYPDFVPYFKEIDTCMFHEHVGMLNSSNYITELKIKSSNYINAGMIPDQDVFFTTNSEESTFDIRYMAAKVNIAVYGAMVTSKDWVQNTFEPFILPKSSEGKNINEGTEYNNPVNK